MADEHGVGDHHDLCFGCGQANLFGLQLELSPTADGVSGRFFVKQDHQGPPGCAHAGVMAAALEEAMAHAGGSHPERFEIELLAPAPVGSFVRVSARRDGKQLIAEALGEDGERMASGHGRAG